ncbi:unnamed protein product [Macrosiphum euphorbiae]|uniref:Uncharacterized protein n=1 Tax=Macrosiphum euphorbiae TaxID=13131 RepID=A0AAV0WB60_9HEMI|nr:unnamed protein product [Macrosiphum euphorbiae]
MFLSYATVPMILLNFFFFYSPIESAMNGKKGGYFCFTCEPENGNQKFYSEAECKRECKDLSKTCVCDDTCYVFIANEGIEMANLGKCSIPTIDELDVVCK